MVWTNKKRCYCKLSGLCSLLIGLLVMSASHTLYVREACVGDERPENQHHGCSVVNFLDGAGLVCILSSVVLFVAGSIATTPSVGRHRNER